MNSVKSPAMFEQGTSNSLRFPVIEALFENGNCFEVQSRIGKIRARLNELSGTAVPMRVKDRIDIIDRLLQNTEKMISSLYSLSENYNPETVEVTYD